MEFARVKEEETDEVLQLYRSLAGTEYCVWDDEYPTEREIAFDMSRNALFCMKHEDQIVGVVSIDDDPAVQTLECWSEELNPAAEVSRVGVSIQWQNRGIARNLLQNVMIELRRQGYKGVRLLVAQENKKAVSSYRKLEFSVAGTCKMFGHKYWCYEKEL